MNFPPKLSQMPILLGEFIAGGVKIADPDSVWITSSVSIGRGTIIHPNSYLVGETCSRIGENCEIGPNALMRDWFEIGNNVKIGFNAEIVRSEIGDGTKIPHFCHVGDAIIGCGCNIAAGTVFCNYDGDKKQRIYVGDYVFIGSGAKLIAPLKIIGHAYIAAGAIVSKDVGPYSLVMGINRRVEGKLSHCDVNNHWHIYQVGKNIG